MSAAAVEFPAAAGEQRPAEIAQAAPLGTGAAATVLAAGEVASNPALAALQWLGRGVLQVMESIGEVVANLLGLNESKFQYVIDGMTEEEWEVARQVQAERLREEGVSAPDVETAVDQQEIEARMAKTQQSMLLFREGK